jgi:hypothetical protein
MFIDRLCIGVVVGAIFVVLYACVMIVFLVVSHHPTTPGWTVLPLIAGAITCAFIGFKKVKTA